MTYARIEALLDTPLRQLSDADIREIAAGIPEEWAYICARIRDASADLHSPAHTALYIDLMRRYPRSRDYYRERAEDARWRRVDRKRVRDNRSRPGRDRCSSFPPAPGSVQPRGARRAPVEHSPSYS